MRWFILLAIVFTSYSTAYNQTFTKTPVTTALSMPVAFELSSDGRIFITEKNTGEILAFDTAGNFLSVFYNFGDTLSLNSEFGLLGITLDPDFANNHYLYVFYNYIEFPFVPSGDERIRIQRFTDVNNVGTAPVIICDIDVPDGQAGNHTGGNIHFRPSDSTHIYVSIGDLASSALGPDSTFSQYLDNPFGKILRISKYPGGPAPADNPFYDDGNPLTGNCDWIWAYGLRNSFDFCFNPLNDSMYATENGTSIYDEINLITKGGNYGWPWCEGAGDRDTTTLPCHLQNAIDPIVAFPLPIPSLTGIMVYTDSSWSQQTNHLISGSYNWTELVDVTLGNAPFYDTVPASTWWLDLAMTSGFTCIRQSQDGCIYELEGGYTSAPGLFKVCPTDVGVASTIRPAVALKSTPNPTNGVLFISYSLPESGPVSLSLTDELGHEIVIVNAVPHAAGSHTLEIDLNSMHLANGVYTLGLRTQDNLSIQKVVLVNTP